MSTAAISSVADIEVFRHQARTVHKVVHINLEGISQQDSLVQPEKGGNCINWVLGHLLYVYDQALPLLGQKPVMQPGALERYERGSMPLEDSAEAIELGDLLSAWDEAAKRIDEGLQRFDPGRLDQPAPVSPSNDPKETVRTLLSTIFFHQAYHSGQTGTLRRICGKQGAIR